MNKCPTHHSSGSGYRQPLNSNIRPNYMKRNLILILIFFGIESTSAYATDARERRFISQGMSEGQVLVKIGQPDSESIDSGRYANGRYAVEKRWSYFPHQGDSQTLTTIILREGKVIEITREISR